MDFHVFCHSGHFYFEHQISLLVLHFVATTTKPSTEHYIMYLYIRMALIVPAEGTDFYLNIKCEKINMAREKSEEHQLRFHHIEREYPNKV